MTIDPTLPFRTRLRPRALPRALDEAPRLPNPRPGSISQGKVVLINPFYAKDPYASFGKHVLTPTLALTSIAGATPAGWEVRYWDENLLQGCPPRDPIPEVVGITVHLTFAERAYALARWYRAHGSIVVMGGLHTLSCPDEVAGHADAVAVGDGVQLWPRILNDIRGGRLQKIYTADFGREYAADPAPRRDILPRNAFLTTTSINATRGCHNRCGFCYLSTKGLRMPYKMRTPAQVAEEIRADGQPYVVFTDNNLGSSKRYLHDLCRAIEPLGIIWSAAVTIDVTDDPALVRAMGRSGCTGVFVGFESLQDENLREAHKKTPRAEDYARRVRLLHDNGIQVNGSFVLGFDHDRKDVFAQTAQWVEEHRLECATFHILTPYPATPLFAQLEAEGRILHREWSHYDTANAVFRPKHMTPEELEHGYRWMYERLFSHQSIWRRRPSDPLAVAPYLAMSYLYKRSNWAWQRLIERGLTNAAWRPLVELSRQRHLRFRETLAALPVGQPSGRRSLTVVSASV